MIFSFRPLNTDADVHAPGCSFLMFLFALLIFGIILFTLATTVFQK